MQIGICILFKCLFYLKSKVMLYWTKLPDDPQCVLGESQF